MTKGVDGLAPVAASPSPSFGAVMMAGAMAMIHDALSTMPLDARAEMAKDIGIFLGEATRPSQEMIVQKVGSWMSSETTFEQGVPNETYQKQWDDDARAAGF